MKLVTVLRSLTSNLRGCADGSDSKSASVGEGSLTHNGGAVVRETLAQLDKGDGEELEGDVVRDTAQSGQLLERGRILVVGQGRGAAGNRGLALGIAREGHGGSLLVNDIGAQLGAADVEVVSSSHLVFVSSSGR